jgi:hypothetical protein
MIVKYIVARYNVTILTTNPMDWEIVESRECHRTASSNRRSFEFSPEGHPYNEEDKVY